MAHLRDDTPYIHDPSTGRHVRDSGLNQQQRCPHIDVVSLVEGGYVQVGEGEGVHDGACIVNYYVDRGRVEGALGGRDESRAEV